MVLASVLAMAGLAAGLIGAVSVQSRATLLDDVAAKSSPVSAAALDVYRSLSDADAAIASSMLAGGAQSQMLYERYRADISNTAKALSIAVVGAPSADRAATGDSAATAAAQLSDYLPVYTGLVETARTYTRLGKPLGAAYLRQASTLVRGKMLPLAWRLYESETQRKSSEQAEAGQAPWGALAMIALTVAALIAVQVYLFRRTKRLFNVGLVAATLVAIGGLAWLAVSAAGVGAGVREARAHGTAQLTAIAKARIAGLQAHADEAMTLFASEADFEKAYDDTMAKLAGPLGSLTAAKVVMSQPDTRAAMDAADQALKSWMTAHDDMRRLADAGDQKAAVMKADELVRLADDYDSRLDEAMRQASGRFETASREARAALSSTDIGVAVLLGLSVLLAVAGMWPRIAEYR